MSPARFLRDYWQKHPLLIRQAFAGFVPPIAPDELAGLACEDGALSRLIKHDGARARWQVKTGPLEEADFAATGDANWTLLVQDVDKWDAEVAKLLDAFDFLPSWRVDDVMISYAEPGGGVGAHVDQYDVFLIQGLGRRRWAISTDPAAPRDFRPDVELKQLLRFEPTHTWVLEPGDALYLPPDVPHDGVAVGGPCMTLSIGMRAPAQAELLGDLADYLAERLPDEKRYADPDLAPARAVGEIDRAALARLRDLPFAATLDETTLRDWFGRFITRYRLARTPAPPQRALSAHALRQRLADGAQLLRHPWTRLAWSRVGARAAMLFANGHAWPCPRTFAERLCAQRTLEFGRHAPDEAELAVLLALVNEGLLVARKSRRR
jgi:50S ribosomal protein L16 3-hydroxylase